MKHLTAIIAVIIGSILVGCNQKIKQSRLFVPKQIQWDTLKGGFEDDTDLYHKAFFVLYVSNDTLYKIKTENELINDSILTVTSASCAEAFEIKEITPEMLVVERENKKDTIFLAHYTDHKVHKQSINRVKQWIYGKYPAPEIVIPN